MADPKAKPIQKAAPQLVDRKATAAKPAPPKPSSAAVAKPPAPPPKPLAKPVPKARPAIAPTNGGGNVFARIAAEPEKIGEWLHGRSGWVDEIAAIVIIVGGLVSLLAVLNTTPSVTIVNAWADTLRSWVGQVGGALFSGMVFCAGLLIVLPKIGVRIPLTWRRLILIEVAFAALLGFLSTLARDPEPRAVARAGGGGGYIGWALTNLVSKPFGYAFGLFFFALVIIVCIAAVFGVTRAHVRQALITTREKANAGAEWLTKERPPRPRRVRARTAMAAPLAVESTMAQPLFEADVANSPIQPPAHWSALPTEPAEPVDPLPEAQPVSDIRAEYLSPLPPSPAIAPANPVPRPFDSNPLAVRPPAERTGPRAIEPTTAPPSTAKPRPQPASRPIPTPPPERTQRYFTVEDFKEARAPLVRESDLPPADLLSVAELNRPNESEINTNVRIIENTLLEFDIDVEVIDVKVGPTVTQYAVQPFREVVDDQGRVTMQRVRVNKIASLDSDLALALSAKTLRIQPFVPGHSYMGIEVPNRKPSLVALRPVMETEAFAKAFNTRDPENPAQRTSHPIVVPLGRDVSGHPVIADLAAMPHTLIAGTTGSGKSVCITAIAVSLIMLNHPDRVKLIMLDPKMVELTRFNGIPHLMGPVETDLDRIIGVLRWATREMDRRYKLLEAESARNIETYNRTLGKRRLADQLPYLVILIDEIGDLMLSRPDETERAITRIAQMARAVGMHLVVATQRPSVDVITGLIKANIPSRVAFAVASGIDSRVILDSVGAESLMGRGDMLFQSSDMGSPVRVQGCFVSDAEIDSTVNYWKSWWAEKRASGEWDQPSVGPWEMGLTRRESHSQDEPLLEDAISVAARAGEVSTSMLQTKLGVDMRHATKLLDLMQDLGILGGTKPDGRTREVTLKPGTDQYKKFMERRRGMA